jgi:threonyl-tRNA synthetase
MATITLPDGSAKQIPDGTTVGQLAESIGKRLAAAAIVGRVDGKLVDLSHKLSGEHSVSIVTDRDPDGLFVVRHSTAHVLAQALRHLYGEKVQYTIGPVVDDRFYYDFELPSGFSVEELPKVEAEMQKIIDADFTFARDEVTTDHARELLRGQGQRFKDEIIDELAAAGEKTVSTYRQGDFLDLCRGPHVPSTGKIKAFKLLSVAGAYWRGDAAKQQLTRIYGTAFFDKKELGNYARVIEESKKRDHRVLGPQLGLFAIDETVGQGLVLWKPKGAVVRNELQKFIREHLVRQGYHEVFTPHIGRLELYKTSGHYPYYRQSQFPPLIDQDQIEALAKEHCSCAELSSRMEKGEIDGYLLKPMNCPHHIKIFASDPHSYRDLPVRLAEFGTVYRWEKSGELGGMTRVRGFTQDDAHLFCTEEQLGAELHGCLELVKIVFSTLGMTDYRVRVGLRDPDSAKYVGSADQWDKAEAACLAAARSLGVSFTTEPGEAAFYGPKIDFVVRDVLGRSWQLGTVQVDYQLPQRFGLTYTGADNKPHAPVMIHRAPFGSMERFIGVLIEHFEGAFPLWLSPVQVAILTISERFNDYAAKVAATLSSAGLRVESHLGPEKIGAKIRTATLAKVSYQLILGEKEEQGQTVAIRTRTGEQQTMSLADFAQRCAHEASSRILKS